MDEMLYIKRSIYRELFNNLCADFSHCRTRCDVDDEFLNIEKQAWDFREKSLRMEYDDIKQYDEFLCMAQSYLSSKE